MKDYPQNKSVCLPLTQLAFITEFIAALARSNRRFLLIMLNTFLLTSAAIADFNPILIDDDNNHRIWKITGNASNIYDLTGVNLNDGVAPDLVQVGSYSLDYNIQDLATDNNGQVWAIALGTGTSITTAGNAYIGRLTENAGTYSYTNITDLGATYNDPAKLNHGKALVWDPDNQYFIYEANPTQNDPLSATFKAYDPATNSVVADPWGTGNAEIVVTLPVNQTDTHAQGLTFGSDGSLYAVIGYNPTIILKLERNAQHKLTGGSTMIGTPGLGINLRNVEVLTFAADGRLLAIESNAGAAGNKGMVYAIDIATGTPTIVADLDNGYATKRDWEGIQFSDPAYDPAASKCFAMTDNVAELYSFDLDIGTAPTKVATSMLLNGEGATYRSSDNSIYTFHQQITENEQPSDLYKVTLDGTVSLVRANFLSEGAAGVEFVSYSDGSERLFVLQHQHDSKLLVFDAQDLTNNNPLSTIQLLFPDGSNAGVAGLAVNPATGEVLVVDDDASGPADYSTIYSVNLVTGQLTLITTFTDTEIDAESLAFAEDGYLYTESDRSSAAAANQNKIFRIDLSTGNLTAVETNINNVVSGDIEGMSCTGSKILTPPPFSCDVDAYVTHAQSLVSTQSSISSINIATGTKTLEQANIHPNVINAIGYNVVDNYLWGYDRGTEQVVRIDSSYKVTPYTIAGLPQNSYHIGDVSQEGILYLAERWNEPDKIYRVDVNPSSATYLQALPAITLSNNTVFNASDFAFHPGDGMIYIPNDDGNLYKIHPSTGVISNVGDMQITGYSNANVTFFDRDGYYYINSSGNNNLYRIDLRNTASPNPVGSVFSTVSIPAEADGARCPNAPIGTNLTIVHKVINDNGGVLGGSNFAITTDAGVLTFNSGLLSGDTTTYTTNPLIISAGAFSLVAPDVSGYAQTASLWSCTGSGGVELASGNAMSSGTLTGSVTIAEGDSVTCTITYDDSDSCSALSGAVNVAISPISLLKTEAGNYKNKLFVATTDESNNTGNVVAYAIGSDEKPISSSSWSAAGAMSTQNQRGARLFTSVVSGQNSSLVAFNSSSLTNVSFQSNGVPSYQTIKTNVASATMGRVSPDSNIALLQDDVNALKYLGELGYRSFYTSTISKRSSTTGATVPSQVLVTSDDGFIYSFNQSNGYLNWGWMPPSLALELKNAAGFADEHFMKGEIDPLDLKSGTIGSYSFDSYIVGSYRNGLGQYVLKINASSGLSSVISDIDHTVANVLADNAPNQGKRAYFSDANGIQYMAYIITSSGTNSVLHLTKMIDGTHVAITLGFTATSTPFVMPDLRGSAAPAANKIYLGSDDGNIYSASLFENNNLIIDQSGLISAFYSNSTSQGTIHPSNQSASAILYIGASVAVGGKYYLHAQADDRITLFNYDISGANWNQSWTTSTAASLTGKWTTTNGVASFGTDTSITPLPADARLTDAAYIIANSIVLPVTEISADNNVCYGDAYYYFYKLPTGYKPVKTFFSTSNHAAITAGKIRLGKGDAMSMHLTTTPIAKKLVALGLADQDINNGTGISESFYVNDLITSGIRSWKELH